MGYGFVIDQGRCIGCHACTVACKQENRVPLGRFRTWVKYVEKGTFPAVRRHFTVLRCNHCDAAPCVEICPVGALHKRKDAIVDLDRDTCIGCRACMQACPYDALYLNEDSGVAEKCHYCAHRTEVGLEPACVNVCPVQAIVSGDVDDPSSRIAQVLASEPTTRRKLEKGTRPRLWYVDALPEALVPSRQVEPSAYLWSDRSPEDVRADIPPPPGSDATVTLDVAHPPTWGWHVWAYLLTKNVAAGAALVAPFLAWLGAPPGLARDVGPELVALGAWILTNALLVLDLGRPERSWRIFFAPNTRSWLVRGAWILSAFGLVTTASLALRWLGHGGAADAARLVNVPIAVLTSGYTAWLLAQCRGRDLWLSRLLLPQLVARAALLGLLVALLLGAPAVLETGVLLLVNVLLAGWEFFEVPETADGRAAHVLLHGGFRFHARQLVLVASLPVVVVAWWGGEGEPGTRELLLSAVAAALVLLSLAWQERAFIRAGQAVPLS